MSRAAYYATFFTDAFLRKIVTYAVVIYGVEVLGGGDWSGLLYLTLVAPYLLSLHAGGVIDRIGRRAVLQGTCGATLTILVLLLLISRGDAPVGWTVAALTLCYGVVSAFAYPAFVAAVPEVAPPEEVSRVTVSVNVLAMLAHVAGPIAVGLLRAFVPWSAFFVVPALLAAGNWLALQVVPLPRRAPASPHGPAGAGIAELLALCRARPQLAGILLAVALFSALVVGPFEVLGPLFADDSLALPPVLAGSFLAAGGAGMVVGAIGALAVVGRGSLGGWLCGSGVVGGALVLVMTTVSPEVAFPLFFLAGVIAGVFTSLSIAGAQRYAPDRLRGRVMGLYALALGAPPALGGGVAGVLSEGLGVETTFRVIFVGVMVVFGGLYLVMRGVGVAEDPVGEPGSDGRREGPLGAAVE